MEFIREEKGLKITIDETDKKFLQEVKEDNDGLETEKAEDDFFEPFLANSEFEWVSPEDIMALTGAPILGVRDENDKVVEAYGYMDYAVSSMLEILDIYGEVFLQKG